MAEPKTKVTKASVAKFIAAIKDAQVREDCRAIAKMMETATKAKARMYGSAIVGFGVQTIVYAGGREGEWPALAFSPRKGTLVLYGMVQIVELEEKLGKHSRGKGCLYIKRLEDVHLPTLKKIASASVMRKKAKG